MTPDTGRPSPPPSSPPSSPPSQPDPAPRVAPEPPAARVERSRWPGWIWGIPVAAVAIVAWLAFKQLAATGPEVTVIFAGAHGISANQTEVDYEGLKVGEVTSVRLEKDLRHVRTTIRLSSEMDDHIGPGTEFWINGPSLSDLSSIRSVISGPTIGIQPRPGEKQDEYQGLAQAPVVSEPVPGRHFVLKTDQLGTVSRGSQIYYHDLSVGKVETTKLLPDHGFQIDIFITAPYDKLVHDGSRFWNAGAVQVSLQGSGPRLQMQSLPALLSGAVAFDTPNGADEGPQAQDGHPFRLYDSKSTAEFAPGPQAVMYRTVFGPEAGGLGKGDAVQLAGNQIGTVQEAQLQYDPSSGALHELVTFAVDPSRIALPADAHWPATGRAPMDDFMRRLIGEGLRAQPGSAVPFIGPKTVDLAFVGKATPATLTAGNPPEFPAAQGGGGIDGLMTAVSGIAGKLDNLPLDQIAGNIRTLTDRLAALSESPELTASLDSLHKSVANMQQITASAKADVPALLSSLRKVASQADRTVAEAQHLISTTAGNGPMGVNTAGLGQTLYELSRAAQSVRELTDYLDRHPSALIRGRG